MVTPLAVKATEEPIQIEGLFTLITAAVPTTILPVAVFTHPKVDVPVTV